MGEAVGYGETAGDLGLALLAPLQLQKYGLVAVEG